MTLTAEHMRREIVKVYKGRRWEEKVRKMSDDQVTAVYLSFKRRGKIR